MRYLISLIICLCLWAGASPIWAAATFDAATQATCRSNATPCPTISSVSTLTYSHTVGSGTNRGLAVFAFVGCNTGDDAPGIAGITYNGTPLTSIASEFSNVGWNGRLYAWPPGSEPTSGAHNVVVSLTRLLSDCTMTGVESIQSGAISADGVDQTTTFTSSGASAGTGTSATLTISSSQAGDLGIEALCAGAGVTSTTETIKWNNFFTNNGCGSSGGATAGGSDVSFSWVIPNDHWILIGAAFKGAVAGGTVPVTGTVSWTANTEPDLQGYNLRRCIGAACTPTILLSTITAPIRIYLDATLVSGTTYGYTLNAYDVAGNQSPYSGPVYLVAGASPPAPPTIVTATADATGANLTWTGPPTSIRVDEDAGSSVIHPLSDFPAGRLTQTWLAGSTTVGFFAIDAAGVENDISTAFKYVSLVGIAPAADITPPVLSNGIPAAVLPAGTTSTVMSVTLNEPGSCSYDTTDIAQVTMANDMTMVSLVGSATLTGLTNGSSTVYYVRCLDTHGNFNTSSLAITVAVAASTADVILPTTVASLVATANGSSQANLTWAAATDAGGIAGYRISSCIGVSCSTFLLAKAVGVVTATTITNLLPLTSYSFVVRAIDTSNNLSAADSNVSTITTAATVDVTPPLPMVNLHLAGVFTQSVLLAWNPGFDNSGFVTATIEQCTGAACTNFAVAGNSSGIIGQSLFLSLLPSTTYRFRGLFVDGSSNVSVAYSNIIEVTTNATGLARPREPIIPRDVPTISRTPR